MHHLLVHLRLIFALVPFAGIWIAKGQVNYSHSYHTLVEDPNNAISILQTIYNLFLLAKFCLPTRYR